MKVQVMKMFLLKNMKFMLSDQLFLNLISFFFLALPAISVGMQGLYS